MAYFLDVAETQHMTRSAKRLNIAQPALSRSMARLEQELGVALFGRIGRGLRMTDERRLPKRRIKGIVAQIDEVRSELSRVAGESEQEVCVQVGAGSRLAAQAVATWLGADVARRIRLYQGSVPETEGVDVVMAMAAVPAAALERVFSERIMVAVPADRSFDRVPVPLMDLEQEGFVTLAATAGFSRFTRSLCAEAGFQPRVVLASDNPDTVRTMIGLGLGVGFWPELSWGDVRGAGARLYPLAVPRRRELHVALLAHAQDNPAARAFYDHLVQVLNRCFEGA